MTSPVLILQIQPPFPSLPNKAPAAAAIMSYPLLFFTGCTFSLLHASKLSVSLPEIVYLFAAPRGLGLVFVPQPGIEPGPPAVEARNPNDWTTREFPLPKIILTLILYVLMSNLSFKCTLGYLLTKVRWVLPCVTLLSQPQIMGQSHCIDGYALAVSLSSVGSLIHLCTPRIQETHDHC